MSSGRFDATQLSDEALQAFVTVYEIVYGITTYRDASLYDASDCAAAQDIRQGIEYLRAPVEWVTQTHYKEPYQHKEHNS